MLRLCSALREYFPAELAAFDDLTAPDTLELLAAAPDPARVARLSRSRIVGACKRAQRGNVEAHAERIQTELHTPQLGQPAELVAAYAATVSALVAVIAALNTQGQRIAGSGRGVFGRHRRCGDLPEAARPR